MDEGQNTSSGLGGNDDRSDFSADNTVLEIQHSDGVAQGVEQITGQGAEQDAGQAALQTVAAESTMPVSPIQPAAPVVPVSPVSPVNPARPVNPAQPVNPVAPVQPVQPIQPAGRSVQPTPMAGTPMMGAPMQSMQQMTSQPLSQGTGDIVLAPEQKSRKKLWIILGAVAAGVVLIAIIVAVILGGGGGNAEDIEYTGLRGAFNQYANYFLSGEASRKDIAFTMDEDDGDGSAENENETADENGGYLGVAEVVYDEDEDDSNDDAEEVDISEVKVLEDGESYFSFMMESDVSDKQEYVDSIVSYFDDYSKYIMDEEDGYNEIQELLTDYTNIFYLVLINSGSGKLDREMILDAYLQGGDEKANKVIDDAAGAFVEIEDVFETNFSELTKQYGQQELVLIKEYQDLGCIVNDEIHYSCVIAIRENEEVTEMEVLLEEYLHRRISVVEDCITNLEDGIYDFADYIYNGSGEGDEIEDEE